MVNRIIRANQELKYFDQIYVAASLNYVPQIHQISAVPQGNTDITRNGDRLKMYKVYFRGDVTNFSADPYNRIRLIMFQWFPATLPTSGSILLPGLSGVVDWASHYAHDTRQEYRILYDRTYKMVGNASAATTPNTVASVVQFKGIVRVPRKQLQYQAGTTVGTNQVYLMVFSDSTAIPNPGFNICYKCTFTDS